MHSIRRLSGACALTLGLACAIPALAQDVPHVAPQNLSSYWIRLNTEVGVDMPNSGENLFKPVCVAVSYLIGSDGVPMDLKVRKVVPNSALSSAALSAVSHFRYGPSLSNRTEQPIATYYVVPFNAPDDPAKRQQLMDACKLPGYQ